MLGRSSAFAWCRRLWSVRYAPHLIAFGVVATAYLAGGLAFMDSRLGDARFRLVQRDATGGLVLAAIDAASLKELGVWPWPRDVHARLLDELRGKLVNRVFFDVDFSSPSDNPAQDRNLADAVERAAGIVILPSFQQVQRTDDGGSRIVATLPLPDLRRFAVVAGANVRPDEDGLVRRYATYQSVGDAQTISATALLAGFRPTLSTLFAIDFGIRVDTIPTYSVSDILNGRVPEGALAGRNVIVGATAIELGDQLAVPRYGVLPSPYILALAAESLSQDRALVTVRGAIVLAGALLLALVLGPRLDSWHWRGGVLALAAVFVGSFAFAFALQAAFPVYLDISPWLLTASLCAIASWMRQIDRQTILASRLAIEASEQRRILRNLADNAFEGILLLSADGRIDYANPAAERLFGFRAEELVGGNVDRLLDREVVEYMVSGERAPQGLHEATGSRKDGEPVVLEIAVSDANSRLGRSAANQEASPRRLLLCSLRDVGERKRTEEDFRRRHDRMLELSNQYSLGELAVGLAHEINQPLAAINAYLGGSLVRLAERADMPEAILSAIRSALQQAERIAEIVGRTRNQMRAFDLRLSMIDLNETIREAVDLMKFELANRGVSVSLYLASDLPSVELDKLQIQQVIHNLIRNAAEAMANLPPPARTVRISTRRAPGPNVNIMIADSGPGISPELAPKIFFPFITSKQNGAGIGLSICHAVVERHGGRIKVASAQGQPAVFSIILPIRQAGQFRTAS